jgi:hypothetical protein
MCICHFDRYECGHQVEIWGFHEVCTYCDVTSNYQPTQCPDRKSTEDVLYPYKKQCRNCEIPERETLDGGSSGAEKLQVGRAKSSSETGSGVGVIKLPIRNRRQ